MQDGWRLIRSRDGAAVAVHRHEPGDRLAQGQTLFLGRGLDHRGCDHLVARRGIHQAGKLVRAHRRVQVQFRKRGLLEHPALGIQGLQLHYEPRVLLAPEPVAEAQRILRLEPYDIGHPAGHALLPQGARTVELGNRSPRDHGHAREQA